MFKNQKRVCGNSQTLFDAYSLSLGFRGKFKICNTIEKIDFASHVCLYNQFILYYSRGKAISETKKKTIPMI